MSEKGNPWFSLERASGLIPPPVTAGSTPLLPPPDPPDPLPSASSLFESQFPTLSKTTAHPSLSKKQTSHLSETASLGKDLSKSTGQNTSTNSIDAGSMEFTSGSGNVATTTVHVNSSEDIFKGFTALPSKHSSPLLPDYSSSSQKTRLPATKNPPKLKSKIFIPLPPRPSANSTKTSTQDPPPSETPAPPPAKTWAQKAYPIADRSLKRLAPISYSSTGVPQVTIPDEVFQQGADMHKEFIVGAFLAKMPSYQAIQSVLNYLWGKGQKLDIRTNLQDRTILVRIPNEFTRKKVLEKRLWYVGTAMFQV
ncbi:hypothetical protein DY000_02011638 [Brassica cretica]|uniref:DUF4283 domain-containing protein n=1 Tax=Brassica cretica TaxID=69181 RepID=A0ABQ7D1M7_BRACR|nr:hypothetical protein DY000_02011638 [Brassica cretica]